MERNALADERGFTIIEVLIALTFLAVVALALMQTSMVAYQENLRNTVRDEAVRIAEEKMNDLRSEQYTANAVSLSLTQGTASETFTRRLRLGDVNYQVQTQISDVGTTNKQITITVSWNLRGRPFSHSVTSIIGRT